MALAKASAPGGITINNGIRKNEVNWIERESMFFGGGGNRDASIRSI